MISGTLPEASRTGVGSTRPALTTSVSEHVMADADRTIAVTCLQCGKVRVWKSHFNRAKRLTRCQKCAVSKHGEALTRLWTIWTGINSRCATHASKGHPHYSGRGIKVCQEWHAYEPFAAWAKANGYAEGLQIDRIDNDGPYSPENCRWVTPAENSRNRRTNKMLTFNGRTQCITDWAKEMGVYNTLLCKRLDRGWSVERALSTPCGKYQRRA